ncbi:MAG: hypothetical protein HYZ28_10300 [Myxococcales bacterium]|nr:hypothetical protein [Myxococcales bacterium]
MDRAAGLAVVARGGGAGYHAHHMAARRTTIILGGGERRAAKELAARWGVTPSEAIRRALLKVEAQEIEAAAERKRRKRKANLPFLLAAFRGHRRLLDAELARIAAERDAW